MNFRRIPLRIVLLAVNLVVLALAIVLFPHPNPEPPPLPAANLPQVAHLPQGAAACDVIYADVKTPFNAGAQGTPMTTCGFVEQIRRAYAAQTSATTGTYQLRVVSPATKKWYNVVCMGSGDYATCSGGLGALIYLYNKT
jgi:hypothetical protein